MAADDRAAAGRAVPEEGRAGPAARDALGLQTPELQEGEAAEIERLAGLAPLRAALAEELSRLGGDQREALRLRVVEERPYPEVALLARRDRGDSPGARLARAAGAGGGAGTASADGGRAAMRVLDELEREIERIALRGRRRSRPRRWWRRSSALLVLLPLTRRHGRGGRARPASSPASRSRIRRACTSTPSSGLGVIAGPGKLFDVRAADPAGGPPWAVRMVKTSRGLGCVQLGRLVDGKLGVLGRDGAFGTTASSTSSVPRSSSRPTASRPTEPGNVFLAMSYIGLPASGDGAGCAARVRGLDARRSARPGRCATCSTACSARKPTAVTYRDASGRLVRQPVSRPEGAYLVVLPDRPEAPQRRLLLARRDARNRPAQCGVPRRQHLPDRQRAHGSAAPAAAR